MLFEPPYAKTTHYSQIPDLSPGDPLFLELQAYRRLMPGFLTAGLEGRWVLVCGGELIGEYATFAEAGAAGFARFGQGPYLLKRVHEYEPVFYTSLSRVA